MVSTRGVRYKFSEGERVLCYEPDPTKAKVLYDSKVLEVIESKDKRGRRTVEYLIHFQGWNSSWDRCVSEDFVLKDTEENRQLQRDLAEKSQLQLGAYLYRRERKKGSGSSSTAAGSGAGKRARSGFSDDGSSSSTQPEEGELGDSGSSCCDGFGSQPQSPQPPSPQPALASSCRATINIPSSLRDRLTFDYHLVVKRGKLARLPATPCVADILESFVKWFARAGAWHPQRSRYDPPHKPDLADVSCRLNLVREVADGLRVYFDFVLGGHLLYKQELEQYREVCGQFLQRQEEEEEDAFRAASLEAAAASAETGLKSPKLAEYSHLPPDPSDIDKNGGTSVGKNNDTTKVEETVKTETSEMPAPAGAVRHERAENGYHQPALTSAATLVAAYSAAHAAPSAPTAPTAPTAAKQRDRVCTRSTALARRLRSHKSAVSQSEHEEPAASTSAPDPRAFETLSSSLESSGSSLGEGWPAQSATPGPSTRTPISVLLDKVSKWDLITRRIDTLFLPCRIYGAVHIARLFVKLPEFLSMTAMSDYKLKIVLKHVELFVQFLNEHIEWFGEPNYVDNTSGLH